MEQKFICENCGSSNMADDEVTLKCLNCGAAFNKSWADLGVKRPKDKRTLLKNPNPQNIHFGELLPPLEDSIKIGEDALNTDYKGGVQENLEWIATEEANMYALGTCPAPRPYTNLAILARKLKDYDLEIVVCERAAKIAKMHDQIVKQSGERQIRFSQTSIDKVIARLPKARELKRAKDDK